MTRICWSAAKRLFHHLTPRLRAALTNESVATLDCDRPMQEPSAPPSATAIHVMVATPSLGLAQSESLLAGRCSYGAAPEEPLAATPPSMISGFCVSSFERCSRT